MCNWLRGALWICAPSAPGTARGGPARWLGARRARHRTRVGLCIRRSGVLVDLRWVHHSLQGVFWVCAWR